jgi:fatty-acyl-CoA synthase
MRFLPACPLMHGTGQFTSFINSFGAGATVLLPGRRFDPAELWRTVAAHRVNGLIIVGDAFAKPLLAELDSNPGVYDLSSLVVMVSSGVMWSLEVKQGLLKHHGSMILIDSLGSSEAVGLAQSTSTAGSESETAKFALGEHVHVFTDDERPVEPGSDDVGFVAISGHIPFGYYKDPEKTAKTFRTIDGVRYSIPGDYAMVNADGTLQLLGRGSVCINTGGEKVFPEEVEEVIKERSDVLDAVCVGVPDERFGEAIVAIVEPNQGEHIETEALIEHVKSRLARYKAPRHVIEVDTLGRSPAGKVDYRALQGLARQRLGVGS